LVIGRYAMGRPLGYWVLVIGRYAIGRSHSPFMGVQYPIGEAVL
jgi:predicted MFS family arabinose efflux permease